MSQQAPLNFPPHPHADDDDVDDNNDDEDDDGRLWSYLELLGSTASSSEFLVGAFLFPALFFATRTLVQRLCRRIDDDVVVDGEDEKTDGSRQTIRSRETDYASDNGAASAFLISTSTSTSSPVSTHLDRLRRVSLDSREFLAVRFVSAFQAVLAVICGCAILHSCAHDVIHATHWTAKFYVRLAAPYFLYDIWAMFRAFREEERNNAARNDDDVNGYDVNHDGGRKNSDDRDNVGEVASTEKRRRGRRRRDAVVAVAASWWSFLRGNAVIVAHHLFVPFVLFPGVLGPWRRERGDFIIACFFLLEASTPFVSLRAALHRLGLAKTAAYAVNGVLMVVVFGCCRILIFPFIYWIYSRQNITGQAMPFWRVPFAIPFHCNVWCFALFSLQLFWFAKMMRGAAKLIAGRRREAAGADLNTTTMTTTSTSNENDDDGAAYDNAKNMDNNNVSKSNNNNYNCDDNKNEPVTTGGINQSINQKLDSLSSALSFSTSTISAGNFRPKAD